MNNRERFHRILDFQPVDHGLHWEFGLWAQTLDRWHREGLPEDVWVPDWLIRGCEYLGLDRNYELHLRVVDMMPAFKEEVLEEDRRYRVQRFADGHVSRLLKDGESGDWRMSMDQYLSFPVVDRASWQDVRRRYNAHSPARYPMWWGDIRRSLAGHDYPVALTRFGCFGLYSSLRRLMGTELACTIFYDDPTLAEEILDYLSGYLLDLVHRALDELEVDYFNYFEDFAYKTGPLIGPNIFKRFLLPHYRRINDFMRAHGVRHITLDSDGNCDVLIPLMIEAGISLLWPLERAAGMDPLLLRAKYGHDLALAGGIDKRSLARGRKAIEEELYHYLPPLLAGGGYIPMVDHWIPPDVPYNDFMYYIEMKRKLLGL